ncbi:MAG: FtsX-like permease family protein [Paraglaciecola sp.]|uniref:ABC transporter permease n=2 Tax=Paraglaciecola sp. TaxID=1920173 RepID=UPI0032633AF4
MIINNLLLAWQFHQQQKHLPHQRFLTWTQAILLVFIVTLSQASQSIQSFLTENLVNLLGADVVISHQHPLTDAHHEVLAELSTNMIVTQYIATTLTHNDKWQRAKLKFVGDGYPLQGKIKISNSLHATSEAVNTGPKPGNIWLDPRLLTSLSLSVGDTLTITNHPFIVSRILQHEPDRLMEGHSVDMRAMLHINDLNKLNLPEDLLGYRYLIASSSQQISQIIAWQKVNLPAAQIYHTKGAHPLALFWQRTENFIGLASIILFFMAAIAIQQLTHVQLRKEQFFSAVCMSLGSSKSTVFQLSIFRWLMHVILMLPAVLLISAVCHWMIIQWLSHTFSDLNWHWQPMLAVQSVLAVSLIFLVFQIPVWAGLRQSSVAQLVNNHQKRISYWLSLICAVAVLAGVAVVYSDNALLSIMVIASIGLSILLILFFSWAGLSFGEKLTQNVSGLMPFALFMMKQRLLSKSTQILGVGLCAFLLLFTLMLLKDLGGTMQAYQRTHDGNLVVSQATKNQMSDIESWAQEQDVDIRQQRPYTYAKLTQVNGQLLADFTQKPSESLATLSRTVRLHWTNTVPSNNRIVTGQWWQANTPNWQQISVEEEVMTDLGLKLGDSLTFYINEQSIVFNISASHVYKSGSGSITFWFQVPSSAIKNITAVHYSMASLELSEQQFPLLNTLWQQHPTLRMVSLQEMTARFDSTLAMVTQVISGFALLIIVLATVVILSSIHGLEAKEKKKNSVIMSFGFSKQTCLKLNVIEWIVTGSIAASGAIVGTYAAGLLIYQSQFSMHYQPNFLWLLGTLSIILLVVTGLGVYASKNSLSSSVRQLMAE